MRLKKKLNLDSSKERTVAGDAEDNEPDGAGNFHPWIGAVFILRAMNVSRQVT